MVKIAPISPHLPTKPKKFCTNPYDIIGPEEEAELKKNPDCLIHLILPEGEGEEFYSNARKAYEQLKSTGAIPYNSSGSYAGSSIEARSSACLSGSGSVSKIFLQI